MTSIPGREVLVGDNPFHGISHLSQDRARSRGEDISVPEQAAAVVEAALESGADGFLFSVSESTLAILRALKKRSSHVHPRLYAITPYTFEYVRLAVVLGGIPALAKKVAGQVIISRNFEAILSGVKGIITNRPEYLLKAYIAYEIGRIRSAMGRNSNLVSVLIHEVITDMAIALNMRWLFESPCVYRRNRGMKPGFDTRNLPLLVQKFKEWNLDLNGVVIACPFNSAGFQMSPSREECERALEQVPQAEVIAFSLLAAGYLQPGEAAEYAAGLTNLKGVVIGVSRKEQAVNTFTLLSDKFKNKGL